MKKYFLIVFFLTFLYPSFGQKTIKDGDKLVFVYYENRPNNFIAIPNLGKLHSFAIYRKLKTETEYKRITTKKKPPLPMRYNATRYGVTWEDKEYHSRDVDYKVVALNKKGEEICEMVVIWDKKE